jgi:hypothetical protein
MSRKLTRDEVLVRARAVRTMAKHQRWAAEMRESGRWKVEEIDDRDTQAAQGPAPDQAAIPGR